jgi:hypothetical protein
MAGNPYGKEGTIWFIHQLAHNHGLVSAYLLAKSCGREGLSLDEANRVAEGLQQNTSLIQLNHRNLFGVGAVAELQPGSANSPRALLAREIDRCLRRNFRPQDPLLAAYLRSFMLGFSEQVIGHADVGDPIWQNFVDDGGLGTDADVKDAMAMRTVMLGTAPFREMRAKELQHMEPKK